MIFQLLFPPKCVLCRKLLTRNETDLCHTCRKNAPEFIKAKNNIPFVAGWTALWYYKDMVRASLIRYKFRNARSYGEVYGKLLAMKLQDTSVDIVTWVPVSRLRRWTRGYDQVQLIAQPTAKHLGLPLCATLKKLRHTRPQSGLNDISKRRANVLGVYAVICPEEIAGKRILLLDDIVTTGATASECARVLLTAGAESVHLAAVAATTHDKK